MTSIKINISEDTTYNIEIKEKYDLEEFMSVFRNHIEKLQNFLGSDEKTITQKSKIETIQQRTYQTNILFDELNELIQKFGKDIEIKENKTMRSFYSSNIHHKKRGLAWLEPREYTLIVYLRKGDYSSVDKEHKIKYSKPNNKTFGDYPCMIVTNKDDINYAHEIISYAYKNL